MMHFLDYSFMVRALLAGTLLGLVAPALGTLVVARRSSLIADTLAHAALAGVGIGVILGISPTWGAVVVAIIAAVGIELLMSQNRFNTDAIMALFLSGGLALAVALISLQGTPINFENYLFGSLITVTNEEIGILMLSGSVVLLFIAFFWWPLVSLSFSEDLTATRGFNIRFLKWTVAILTGLMVSQSLKIVGGLLIGALMVIPVLTAIPLCRSFRSTLRVSVLFALIAIWSGLLISYFYSIPSGSAIVLSSVVVFIFVYLVSRLSNQ